MMMFETICTTDECSPSSGEPAPLSRCVSIPLATNWSYKERPSLSKELREKLWKARDGVGLSHAVAVTGSGGTGKSQLVLRFLEERKGDYNIVLWIDSRNEESVRFSFERCCRALSLPVEDQTAYAPLQDMPCVRAMLLLLRNLAGKNEWLMVIDNADDLSCNISALLPKGNGTVILTSRDAPNPQILSWDTAMMRVDRMEVEEAIALVLDRFTIPPHQDQLCRQLVEEVARCLHCNALATDLAAARIKVAVEDGEDLVAALRGYLSDYRYNRKKLLRDQDFANTDGHVGAVRTACAVSLSSLRKTYNSRSNVFPSELLSFMTFLDQAGAQDELFRLASLGLEESRDRLDALVPTWMRRLLCRSEDDEWDDNVYRATTRVLRRYHLIAPVGEPWRGSMMHSIVRCQTRMEVVNPQYWYWYIVFMAAACVQSEKEADKGHFRRRLVVHLPRKEWLPDLNITSDAGDLRWLWSVIARVLWRACEPGAAEELVREVIAASSRVLGDDHTETINAVANLSSI